MTSIHSRFPGGALGALAVVSLVGCSEVGSSGGSFAGDTGTSSGGTPIDGVGPTVPGQGQPGGAQGGRLTAGTWDDNLNFDFYTKYLRAIEDRQLDGLPRIPRAGRLTVVVADGAGNPAGGVQVTITGAAGRLLEAPTRSDGKLFFFPGAAGAAQGEDLMITASVGGESITAGAKVGDGSVMLRLVSATAAPPRALDLALVVDITGSMGDEIAYLDTEMQSIVGRVAQSFPEVDQRWALIVYRDEGDDFVVKSYDFIDALPTFQDRLSAQQAGGGGDFPEADDRALEALPALSWRQGPVARAAFWVGDAPHHAGREQNVARAITAAQAAGIRIYPISASGTDELLEYTMRTAAQVTGGRYIFLTDDSGIGNSHKEPSIPCYAVTSLDKAMLRMIEMELTGADIAPDPVDILRTSGSPMNGRCTLSDGQQVAAL